MLVSREDTLAIALDTFLRFGFRKTAMEDVAQAVGISRQSLYQHFHTKAALFQDVVAFLLERSLTDAQRELDAPGPPHERLLGALDMWVGRYVESLRASDHASEIIDLANARCGEESKKIERVLTRSIVASLAKFAPGAKRAELKDVALSLTISAKGLVHSANSHDEFRRSMRTIIRVVLRSLLSESPEAPRAPVRHPRSAIKR